MIQNKMNVLIARALSRKEAQLLLILFPINYALVCHLSLFVFSMFDNTTKVTITAIKIKNPMGKNTPNIMSTSGPKTNM